MLPYTTLLRDPVPHALHHNAMLPTDRLRARALKPVPAALPETFCLVIAGLW